MPHPLRSPALSALVISVLGSSAPARAADDLQIVEARLDPPTIHALGVQVLISDDDNRNATVTVRYREEGAPEWRNGLPLLRVRPETVSQPVPQQFAGSVFDLDPDTGYEIELHAVDPEGFDQTIMVTGRTRPVPRLDPASPNVIMVTDAPGLSAALGAAQPGDVITLADGTYAGSFFSISASGTPDDPIVIRGASQAGVILDGQGCAGCNLLEVYGSHVHVERMTLRAAERALRFQSDGTTGNVARRLTIEDVVHGIGSNTNQSAFYICDNTIRGRLVWPWTFDADATTHWDDRGVDVTGDGHVVCHNTIIGFGDPIVNKKSMARSWDIYGNDVQDAYDGTELDEAEGNVRLFHNRYTNVMDPISIQPVRGGPAYVLRNVALNVPEEQIKLKSLGGVDEPSGALIYHNSFASPKLALNLQTPITQHNFEIKNNLFVGPDALAGARAVDWTAALDGGSFDYNGYYPDGGFWFGSVGGENQIYGSFAEAQAGGAVEQGGVLLAAPIFEAGFVGPADEMAHQPAVDFSLAAGSNAIDRALVLPGINERFLGAAPDLGAVESGCPLPVYGPRPEAQEHLTNRIDCDRSTPGPGTGGAGGGGSGAGAGGATGPGGAGAGGAGAGNGAENGGDDGGCGCAAPGSARGNGIGALMLGALVLLRAAGRRRRARPTTPF
jgi:Chondroitinase B